jgi:hypothetical protein
MCLCQWWTNAVSLSKRNLCISLVSKRNLCISLVKFSRVFVRAFIRLCVRVRAHLHGPMWLCSGVHYYGQCVIGQVIWHWHNVRWCFFNYKNILLVWRLFTIMQNVKKYHVKWHGKSKPENCLRWKSGGKFESND